MYKKYYLLNMPWGVAAAAAGGLVAGAWNNAQSAAARRWQTSEREASQLYQTSEREAMQGYQTSEREAQNKYNEEMYLKYQSPEALAEQYRNAGFNPTLALEGGASSSLGVSSGSSGGAPSAHGPSAPGTSAPYMPFDVMTGSFQNMAAAAKALAEAKKTGVETSWLDKIYENNIKESLYRQESMRLGNILDRIDIKYKGKEKEAHLSKLLIDIANGVLTGKHLEAEIKNLGIKNEKDRLIVDNWRTDFDSIIAYRKSETNLNNANAGLSTEKINTEITQQDLNRAKEAEAYSARDVNTVVRKLRQNESAIKYLDALIKKGTYKQEEQTIMAKLFADMLDDEHSIVKLQRYFASLHKGKFNAARFWHWLKDQTDDMPSVGLMFGPPKGK